MQHRVIGGRVYRVVTVEASNTREASTHIMTERPEPLTQEARIRRAQIEAS